MMKSDDSHSQQLEKPPDDALNEVLSFLPFPELQRKALATRQMSRLARSQVEMHIGRTGLEPYQKFVDWRFRTLRLQQLRRYQAAMGKLETFNRRDPLPRARFWTVFGYATRKRPQGGRDHALKLKKEKAATRYRSAMLAIDMDCAKERESLRRRIAEGGNNS